MSSSGDSLSYSEILAGIQKLIERVEKLNGKKKEQGRGNNGKRPPQRVSN